MGCRPVWNCRVWVGWCIALACLTGCGGGAPPAGAEPATTTSISKPVPPPPPPKHLQVGVAAQHQQPGHTGVVRFVLGASDNQKLISGGEDGRVLLWDLPLTKPGVQLDGLTPPLATDGATFAAWQPMSAKVGVFAFSAPTQPQHELPAKPEHPPGFVAFTPASLLIGDGSGSFRLLERAGQERHAWKGSPTPDWRLPAALAASRDGKYLARTYLGSVELRRADDGGEIKALELKGAVPAIAFHPASTSLAVADGLHASKKGKENDTEVVVRSLPDLKKLCELKGNSYRTLAVAFAPDGRLLAVAGDKLQIWDWEQEELLHTSPAPAISTLHWPAPNRLVGGADGGEVAVWELKIEPAP